MRAGTLARRSRRQNEGQVKRRGRRGGPALDCRACASEAASRSRCFAALRSPRPAASAALPEGASADRDAAAGRRIFERKCVSCHNSNGDGRTIVAGHFPYANLIDGKWRTDGSAAAIESQIRLGHDPMPKFEGKLTDEEIRQTVAYVEAMTRTARPAGGAGGARRPMTRRIPLFPLPGVVLLPGTILPLHIFEARYRAMVADALAGDRTIGMAMLQPGGRRGRRDASDPRRRRRRRDRRVRTARGRAVQHPPRRALPIPRARGGAPGSLSRRPRRGDPVRPVSDGAEERDRVATAAVALFTEIAGELELPPLPAEALSPERLASELALRLRYTPAELQALLETDSLAGPVRDADRADAGVEGAPALARAVPADGSGSARN